MKTIPLSGIWVLIIMISFFPGCSAARQVDEDEAADFDNAQFIIPEVEQSSLTNRYSHLEKNGTVLTMKPKVPLDPGEILIQVLNTNLDLDTTGEQILILRERGEAEAPIKIAVVDYDSVRSSYSRTWESATNAANIRTFSITLKDLVGDHNLEIVCRGINKRGELTLDIFRKTPSPAGLGLYFTAIAQIISDGSIEIEEVERSEGYRRGQKNGPSFPIYSYSQDRESENLLDQIKHSYYWQYQKNKYVLSSVEKLEGAAVEEKQLADLFSSTSIEAFEDYLAGPWYLSDSEAKEEIIIFLPEREQISIYSGDVQETYIWKKSFHSLSNRLLIFAENETLRTIVKQIRIEIKSLNTIEVTILGSEQWDRLHGCYLKLTEELQNNLLSREGTETELSDINLAGLYRSDEGIELIFEPPYFTWIADENQFTGGFSLFNLDKGVLQLMGLDENGFYTEEKTYIFEFFQKEENGYLYRTLVLSPGKLSVHGIEPIADRKIIFEQIELLEEG